MRRRRLLALGAAAVGLSGCIENDAAYPVSTPRTTTRTTAAPVTTSRSDEPAETTSIGGSLHGRPFRIEDDLELVQTSTTEWIHAFLDVRKKFDRTVDPRDDPDIQALRRVGEELDVNLIVSFKWNFTGNFGEVEPERFPAPDSRRARDLIEYGTDLLDAIDRPVDIVVLGNEPVWETPDEDLLEGDVPVIPFTLDLKDHLVEHYTAGDPHLLVGGFNRLYDSVWDDYEPFFRRLFELARREDDIDGVDLHVHYYELEQAETMFEIARRECPDGMVTATEFSPVFRYTDNKDEPLGAFEGGDEFADRYGKSSDSTVTEYLEAAKHDRLSRREMADFMQTMPWYNVDFVDDMYDLLNRYDASVGTFGFLVEDDVKHIDWTDGWTPFPINCLFQPALIDTTDGAHPYYLDDFRDRS